MRNEIFKLTPEGCLHWPALGLLAVADIHLGRAESTASSELDLARLTRVAIREGAQEIVFLGAFVHSAFTVTPRLVELFAGWRASFPGTVTVLLGAGDRGLDAHWPHDWTGIARGRELRKKHFLFRHEPPATCAEFCWAGQVHPLVRPNGGEQESPVPCFFLEEHYGLLPAFSLPTEGLEFSPGPHTRIYAISSGRVVSVAEPDSPRAQAV